ncbi:collagen binding domain-containing protein [Paenibacillus senegalensis]|uniref:collagen binding domain-containing protein n=1 Tax=Paenibacillus senegalensis TaxID=1465766 RepID=UPI0002F5B1DD|nr:collagen binding domain-containing protein [Paenibacillus senegalensis]
MKKKVSMVFLSFVLMLHTFLAVGLPSVYSAGKDITENILTDLKVTITDSKNSVTVSVYDNPQGVDLNLSWEQNATVKLEYNWELPNDHDYTAGDTFSFELPDTFKLVNDLNFSLNSGEVSVGTFHVNHLTNRAVMTFNEFIESHEDVKGTLWFETMFNKEKFIEETTQEIVFKINENDYFKLKVRLQPDKVESIEKSGQATNEDGEPQSFNAKKIKWTVDVNSVLSAVYGATVTDVIPSGLELISDSVKVNHLNVNLNGEKTVGDEVDPGSYNVNLDGNNLLIGLGDISEAYRIEYWTRITDASEETSLTFINNAELSGTNITPVSDLDTVTITRGTHLEKRFVRYDRATQTMYWEIKYNYDERNIPDPEIRDLFTNIHSLVDGSLKIYPIKWDADGKDQKGTALVAGEDYQIENISEQEKNGFTLKFINDHKPVTGAYKIEYATGANQLITKPGTVTNEASTGGITKPGVGEYRPFVIEKKL